ncbi:unnamed protein product [Adineta steineri]|uniref:oleoyl-[acyl-carrier-protein] hydrolase n=2 Tax=Adineta steineri TaxID=433720 RepID=A0A815U4I4_9BILA|nr:unnamed protein product [Adineta steineri]CAF1649051.1 unnamed protein product [Adineta steineri]
MASSSTKTHPWFEICHSRPSAKYQVFIFPGAGVPGSYYNDWDRTFPEYEFSLVIYPGRAKRSSENYLSTMKEYLGQLYRELLPYIKKPCIFIGHSIGARICFAFARFMIETRSYQADLIKLIIVMAQGPPHLQDVDPSTTNMTDEELVQEFKRTADPSTKDIYDYKPFIEMLIPLYRADSKIGAEVIPSTPIDVPIIAYGGEKEEFITEPFLNKWTELTKKKDLFRIRMFPGHHSFQSECQTQVLQCLKEDFNTFLNNTKT